MVKYVVVLLCGILSVSCIFDAENCPIVTEPIVVEGERTISFTIGFNNSTTRVKCDPTDQSVPFDYYIDPGTLRVMLTDTNNNAIGEVERLYIWPTNEAQTEFEFTGKLPDGLRFDDPAAPKHKLFAIVNAPAEAIDREFTLYNQKQLDPREENSAIPMWGVMTVDLSPILEQPNYKIPNPLWMLRSAAKIEVQLSDELRKKSEITSATMKYYNVEGYVAPYDWHRFESTLNVDCEKAINVYRHAAVNLPLIKDEATGNYYVYMPEYDNLNYPGERNKITLTMNHAGEAKVFEDAISFVEYSNGKGKEGTDYNIVRNHIYRFTIRSIAGDNLTLEYHVADWDAEDWGTGEDFKEHDISYPTYLNPIVPEEYLTSTPEQQSNYVIKSEPKMYFGGVNNLEAGAFVGYFRITAPSNVLWKPGIMGSKENYRIRVYKMKSNDDEKGELLFDSNVEDLQGNLPACDNNEWFKLVVFPLSGDGAGKNAIDLGISYYQEWTQQYINLFVNGEYNALRWPNSGSNPKIIKIKHVEQVGIVEEDEE
ncbi:MAG: hypothetical protein U0L61_00230 [Alistipes sp.]|nr:hypothetical protein [Alistipes sp.]